jgi:sialate O-acetylesterase
MKLYFVQLAPWRSNWMGLVAAQNKFAAEEENAALAVTADVGNFDDIHPNDKRTVAKRLSLHALKNDYGVSTIKAESPVFKSMKIQGAKVILSFDNVESWYVYADDYSIVPAFEVAGKDGVWHDAKLQNVEKYGIVKGKDLIISSEKVPNPVKVRYMGKNRTAGTLFNEGNLPLGPFVGE